jgi:hypothetical protein
VFLGGRETAVLLLALIVQYHRRCVKVMRTLYATGFKTNVIKYLKGHGNRIAKRHCGPLLTKKIIN